MGTRWLAGSVQITSWTFGAGAAALGALRVGQRARRPGLRRAAPGAAWLVGLQHRRGDWRIPAGGDRRCGGPCRAERRARAVMANRPEEQLEREHSWRPKNANER